MRYYLLAAVIVTMLALPQAATVYVTLNGVAKVVAEITPN